MPAADAPVPIVPTADLERGPLPSPFDVRVTRALDEALPADAALEVAIVAMGKLPSINRRLQVRRDGGVYSVRRKPGGDWQVPFDQPLPAKASAKVAPAVVDDWLAQLERAGFFDHPGYEANRRTQDGTFWIVRARRGGAVHAVVFQNTRPPAIEAVVAAVEAAAPG